MEISEGKRHICQIAEDLYSEYSGVREMQNEAKSIKTGVDTYNMTKKEKFFDFYNMATSIVKSITHKDKVDLEKVSPLIREVVEYEPKLSTVLAAAIILEKYQVDNPKKQEEMEYQTVLWKLENQAKQFSLLGMEPQIDLKTKALLNEAGKFYQGRGQAGNTPAGDYLN